MNNSDIHIRIIYGWAEKLGSEGLIDLGRHLRKLGYDVADDLMWKYPDQIAALLDTDRHQKRAVIGYSMGANCVTWISNRIQRPIHLGVAYDPSRGIPWIMPAYLEKVSPRILRCLHYRGNGFPVGGAPLIGPTVETKRIDQNHFTLIHDQGLHAITLKALEALGGKNS